MTTPIRNELRYKYLAAQGDLPEAEDFHTELFDTPQAAGDFCYFANNNEIRTGKRKLFKQVRPWQVWQIPVTMHWEDVQPFGR